MIVDQNKDVDERLKILEDKLARVESRLLNCQCFSGSETTGLTPEATVQANIDTGGQL